MIPTDPNENDADLFDLAARLAGCDPIDLIKVRRDPAGLVVILATGQKFVFDLASIAPNVEQVIHDQLAAALASRGLPAQQNARLSQSGQQLPDEQPLPAPAAAGDTITGSSQPKNAPARKKAR